MCDSDLLATLLTEATTAIYDSNFLMCLLREGGVVAAGAVDRRHCRHAMKTASFASVML